MMIGEIRAITKPRTIESSVIYAMAELGELSEELCKLTGHSIKPESKDGIVGEAIDVMICLLDVIQLHLKDKSDAEVHNIIEATLTEKINKWQNKIY